MKGNGPVKPAYHALPGTVYDAALRRIRWLWDEFDGNVAVSWSGGKDSTVVMELAAIVAKERGAAPLRVMWLDQECEYEATVTYARYVAARPDIDFRWYQVPFRLFNATDHANPWLNVWGEGEEWVREKDSRSIQVNDYSTGLFADLLNAICERDFGGAILTGVRTEESPARRMGLLSYPGYKWVTWTKKAGKDESHVTFHPIYDFTWRDIWKAIHQGDWAYNSFYDAMFRYGVPASQMRVSNYHHETAVRSLVYLQEVEPDTYERAVQRIQGISTAGHMGRDMHVHRLPFMFRTWVEYHAYLVDNLVPDEATRAIFRKHVADLARRLSGPDGKPYVDVEAIAKAAVQAVIVNDHYFTKGNQFYLANRRPEMHVAAKRKMPGSKKSAAKG